VILAGLSLAGRLLGSVPLWVYPLAAMATAYGYSQMEATRAHQQMTRAVIASAESRVKEQDDARDTERAWAARSSELDRKLALGQAASRAQSRASSERLRVLAEAWSASAAGATPSATCSSLDAPAAGVLRRETREALVVFAEDAEATRLSLLACQDFIRLAREKQSGP
jgi:hypothetical protein